MDLTARDAPPLPDLLDPAVTKSIPDVKKSIQSESLDLVTATDGSFRELKTAKDPCRLDVVVIGDPLVGKTSLIHSYINQVSVVCGNWHLLLPRVIDAKEKQVQFEGHKYTLVVSYKSILKWFLFSFMIRAMIERSESLHILTPISLSCVTVWFIRKVCRILPQNGYLK